MRGWNKMVITPNVDLVVRVVIMAICCTGFIIAINCITREFANKVRREQREEEG